jgi:hypothetical protein
MDSGMRNSRICVTKRVFGDRRRPGFGDARYGMEIRVQTPRCRTGPTPLRYVIVRCLTDRWT